MSGERARACAKCQGRSYRIEAREGGAFAVVCDCTRQCQRCGGKGYLYVAQEETFSQKVGPKSYEVLAPCMCRLLERRVARYNEAHIPRVHAQATFESYVVGFASQDAAKKAAQGFCSGFRKGAGAQN